MWLIVAFVKTILTIGNAMTILYGLIVETKGSMTGRPYVTVDDAFRNSLEDVFIEAIAMRKYLDTRCLAVLKMDTEAMKVGQLYNEITLQSALVDYEWEQMSTLEMRGSIEAERHAEVSHV